MSFFGNAAALNFDVIAKDYASKTFKNLKGSVDRSSSSMDRFKKVSKAAALGFAAGITTAAYAAKKFTEAAIEDQHSVAMMSTALKNATGATNAQVTALDKWIGSVSLMSGVADDDLRPAFAKLVTATGDVDKSQGLLRLAMDAAAATGKSLESVTAALSRGYMGTTGSLGRLGLATKDAKGEALSFNQITDQMQQKFMGAMYDSTQTAAGSMARLKVALSEAGESIGYVLLPYVQKLANWLASTAVPAMQKFINQMQNGRGEGGRFAEKMREAGEQIRRLGQYLAEHRGSVLKFAGAMGGLTAALKVARTAQIGLNIALSANPIGAVIIAVAALSAGYIYAYKNSEKFRTAAQGVNAVLIKQAVAAVSVAVRLKGQLSGSLLFVTGVVVRAANAFESLGLRAAAAIDWVMQKVAGLSSAVSSLLSKLSGLKNIPGVGGLGGLLPRKAAEDIAKGYELSLASITKASLRAAKEAAKAFADGIRQGMVDGLGNARSYAASLRQQFNEFADFKSAFMGNLFGVDVSGQNGPGGVAALLAYSQQQRATADRLRDDTSALAGRGVPQWVLEQLRSQGASGVDAIHALATANPEDYARILANMQAAGVSLGQAGMTAANATTLPAQLDASARAIAAALATPVVLRIPLPGGGFYEAEINLARRQQGRPALP